MRGVTFYRGRYHKPHHPSGPVTTATTDGFPKIFSYTGNSGSGNPVMTSPGVFDQSYIAAFAKRDLVTLNVVPFTTPSTPGNLAIVSQIRAASPTTKVIWYDIIHQRFAFAGSNMWADEYALVTGPPDLQLYYDLVHGGGLYEGRWDIGYTGAATSLANIWKSYCQGKADGYFLDIMISYVNFPAGVDITKPAPGYASQALLQAAMDAGADSFTDQLVGTGYIWGNRGGTAGVPDVTANKWTGEFIERWDPDNGQGGSSVPGPWSDIGGTFDQAMTAALRWQGSSPTGNGTILLMGERGGTAVHSSGWNKLSRYVLGCACIAGGMAYITDGTSIPFSGRDPAEIFNWADEFTVDSTGATDINGSRANKGWLGRPTEFGFKDSSGVYVRHFDRGIVVANGSGSSKTYNLGRTYRRIQGVYDTSVNDGSTITSVTVPNKDARFLIAA